MIPETVFGLPAHPLIVHAVVVLAPLSALGLVVVALVPRWRRAHAPLVAAGSVAALLSAVAAVSAGAAFVEEIGARGELAVRIASHESLGRTVPIVLLLQTVLAVAVVLLDRRGASRAVVLAVTVLSVVAAGAVTVQVVRTGHAGSAAVWNPTG